MSRWMSSALFGAACLLSLAVVACGQSRTPEGREGGPCYRNGTCDDGLTCLSDLCVRLAEDADSFSEDASQEVIDALPSDPGKDDAVSTELLPDLGGDLEDVADTAPDVGVDVPPADACIRSCENKLCGDDGCGAACGSCYGDTVCRDGRCLLPDALCQNGMCRVSAGPFWMGVNIDNSLCPSNALVPDGAPSTSPCHQVNVPEFWMDQFESTVGDYRSYLEARGAGCTNPVDGKSCVPADCQSCTWGKTGWESYPITGISAYQAEGYCNWAGKRLCSESEWEKAARGTDGRLYTWGNGEANCGLVVAPGSDPDCMYPPQTVGLRIADTSPYGIVDMAGNAAEWIADWDHYDYTGAPTDGSAWERDPEDKIGTRVVRGISALVGDSLRATTRGSAYFYSIQYARGVRCCRSEAP